AFAEIERRLLPIMAEHGRNAVAIYLGNPSVHNPANLLFNPAVIKAIGTRNLFTASTVDQMPKHVSSGFMFGNPDSIAVPDLDRTDYLLILGADPWVSNGSLATAPDFPGRVKAIQERGGRLVVVDPRRSRTATEADEHLFIRPGTDPLWMAALAVEVLSRDGQGSLEEHTNGLDLLPGLLARFTPGAVADATGISADVTRRIAGELIDAPTAVVYGRMGTHTARFGTLAAWLADVLNLATGNLDRPGGAMFPRAAHETRRPRPFRTGRWASRVGGHPEVKGEFPVSALADEILTPGESQIRALVTIAGNPVLSTPDAIRLDEAIASLDLVISIDLYRNETTRHADVLLPPPSQLERSHYDLAFYQLSVRNVVNFSPPTFPLEEGRPGEWEILARLAAIAAGLGGGADPSSIDDLVLGTLIGRAVNDPASPVAGRDPAELLTALGDRTGPDRLIDFLLRSGPYGDGFGAVDGGISLDTALDHPHGIDLGPLEPRLPGLLCTSDGLIDAAPEEITADLDRLAEILDAPMPETVLIGRRSLRSNNSWMHNIEVLAKGKARCTLLIHPSDAQRIGLADGGVVRVSSRVDSIDVPADITDDLMPGVVSLPHGWGHDLEGTSLSVASRRPGVNSNVLSDSAVIDPVSGNAVLNGIPVSLRAV
ncbi:molybdopterin-dependent oxidoreductase, partial [bacterium]|nr:molybdopterin-dependent oxidoreductase [bacterium]